MALRHKHRVLFLAPNARVAALRLWIRDNLDATGYPHWFVPCPLKAGYHWFSTSLTDAQLKLLVSQLASLVNLKAPDNFDGLARAQKKQWFSDAKSALKSAAGCVVVVGDSEGPMPDHDAAVREAP